MNSIADNRTLTLTVTTLQDAQAAIKLLQERHQVSCPTCLGDGVQWLGDPANAPTVPCERCGGTGKVWRNA